MKVQYDHKALSSLYLWADDRITRYADAVETGLNQRFYYSNENIDVPPNLVAYYCPDRQLVANGENVPTGVWVSGILDGDGNPQDYIFVGQTTGANPDPTGLMIDFDQGRVLMGTGITNGDASKLAITGAFDRKTLNVYITNETEEQLLFNTDFVLADKDDETFLQDITGLGQANYTVPAMFLSYNSSVNKPWAMGGIMDTVSKFRGVVICNDNYSLDATLSLFRDSTETCVPLFDFTQFPFGEFFHIKNPPYTYSGLYAAGMQGNYGFMEKVTCSKLYDSASSATNIPQNMRIGFVDFELSNFRVPRSEI
mgnify:CR=1 FL=1|tara:strand:+ start:367 stop:1299 length:933 start_codon:yes stop_codon:yes gene_type:complete